MLLGCCHCGETPSESTPPSQSLPPSVSESVPPSESDSGPSYSEISSSCISSFGCVAIPRRLTWSVAVSGGSWDGSADCLCPAYDGTYTLKFCQCYYNGPLNRYELHYATDDLGTWRGRPGFPSTDLIGCRTKTPGTCEPGISLSGSRKYYCVVLQNNIRVFSSRYYTAFDYFPFSRTELSREWLYEGSPNCLASGSYSLPALAREARLDGCGWATGTLTPG